VKIDEIERPLIEIIDNTDDVEPIISQNIKKYETFTIS
jgi:hypothetical protein